MNKLKKDDKVIILIGKDKGKVCTILKVFPKQKKVLLDNANFITKHIKPNNDTEGSIKQINKPLDWNKVRYYDERPLKVGFKIIENKKKRYFKNNDEK
tara:strand:+ start:58 stop:351 length:294 start_codon:yes stop_codon:yes gene_type:complete